MDAVRTVVRFVLVCYNGKTVVVGCRTRWPVLFLYVFVSKAHSSLLILAVYAGVSLDLSTSFEPICPVVCLIAAHFN
jgi:hypothetical protein